MVEISRGNNDADVLVLGAMAAIQDKVEEPLALRLSPPFEGGCHQQPVEQITGTRSLSSA
ncbi:hypothetical protein ABZS81_31425 [Streptomyces sp. NPDC005318]|uniref:hypothetical protein n=1 Tax=Streptomyces sp. NPDC005318 TaxID=3157031 RepID=UPI0033A3BF3C